MKPTMVCGVFSKTLAKRITDIIMCNDRPASVVDHCGFCARKGSAECALPKERDLKKEAT